MPSVKQPVGSGPRGQLALTERAIRLGYPVSDEVKAESCELAKQFLRDKKQSPRTRLMAVKVLMAAEKLNIEVITKLMQLGAESRADSVERSPETFQIARELAKQMQSDPSYMRYLREQAARATIDGHVVESDNGNGNGRAPRTEG